MTFLHVQKMLKFQNEFALTNEVLQQTKSEHSGKANLNKVLNQRYSGNIVRKLAEKQFCSGRG